MGWNFNGVNDFVEAWSMQSNVKEGKDDICKRLNHHKMYFNNYVIENCDHIYFSAMYKKSLLMLLISVLFKIHESETRESTSLRPGK